MTNLPHTRIEATILRRGVANMHGILTPEPAVVSVAVSPGHHEAGIVGVAQIPLDVSKLGSMYADYYGFQIPTNVRIFVQVDLCRGVLASELLGWEPIAVYAIREALLAAGLA